MVVMIWTVCLALESPSQRRWEELTEMSGVQAATRVNYHGDLEGASHVEDVNMAGNDYSFLEGPAADLLTGGPVGKAGLSPRRASWVVTNLVASAWNARQSTLGQSWHATRTSAVLHVQDLHPLILRAVAMLHQLMLSRYATVSSSAVDLLKSMYGWCWDLSLYGLPAIVAAAGVMRNPRCPAPSEALQERFSLPRTSGEVRELLEAESDVRRTCCRCVFANRRSVLSTYGGPFVGHVPQRR
jgi:hypothetical protein